ncbi:EAL domain-containing protein [Erythrobacter sp. HL-111]|uniref:EAL domain-containing protein n=1 Tax=Erythrobacter sp. HL-111 TaxID=1798193 RepID=UPI0006D95A19|nr:EAL domain-containing protein [Erythrobacter sp. HL-111]KPP96656.1 MAG: EAL domain protein [Erythrobacteraceae bacterium HL-111]SDR98695.1 EAL domain, c-di-GMP-specific phosphodiesterase class I (or its enzymatically inactive variant) [Erythrobacter sp. HL-111]
MDRRRSLRGQGLENRPAGGRARAGQGSSVLAGVRPDLLETDLLAALDRREIEVLFQPQFACATGIVTGAEALARWHHPTLGEIGARDLFAIAEPAALVAPLSRHVVARALEQAERWPERLALSLNITPEELGDPRFAADFAGLIGRSAIAPARLMLEITEDVLLRNLKQAGEALAALRKLGFRTALDDFGAGFCNFRYLRELPLDALKLDKTMLDGVPGDRTSLAVFRAIVQVAKALDLAVYAEGVESEVQRAAVVAEGCDHWQGFLRAQPMKSEAMLELARKGRGKGHG